MGRVRRNDGHAQLYAVTPMQVSCFQIRKAFRTSTTISVGRHEMPPWAEVTVDHAVRREESLRLSRRLEPLHLPLSPSGGPMRILSTIIKIPACSVPHIGQDLAMRNSVAAQAV